MRLRTGSPLTNSTAWPALSTRNVRMGWECGGTSLTLTTESAPDRSSSATAAVMSSGVRSGDVGCRIITASG